MNVPQHTSTTEYESAASAFSTAADDGEVGRFDGEGEAPHLSEDQAKVLAQTDRSGECWVWTRAIHKSTGYGATSKNRKSLLAHRFSYEAFVGPIPEGMHLDHLCRNRACVNPAHLEPVSAAENLRRSDDVTGLRSAKTHCPQGHPYEGRNLIWKRSSKRAPRRVCRTCHNASQRRRKAELRGEVAA